MFVSNIFVFDWLKFHIFAWLGLNPDYAPVDIYMYLQSVGRLLWSASYMATLPYASKKDMSFCYYVYHFKAKSLAYQKIYIPALHGPQQIVDELYFFFP